MQKLGSGWNTSSDFYFYRARTKLAMHLLTSWLTLPRTHRAKPSLTICWTLMSLRTAAFLQLYGRRHPLLRSYHEQIMAVNLFIHTSVSHFRDLIPTFIIFSNALLLYQTNAYIQLQNIRSRKLVKIHEETRRDFIRKTWASCTTGQISRKDYICKMCYKLCYQYLSCIGSV